MTASVDDQPISDGISIKYAAMLLDRPLEQIEALVRRSVVVPLYGSRGRGGTLRMERAKLVMLDVAARLDDVRVPRTELASIVRDLDAAVHLHAERTAIVVRPYMRHAIVDARDVASLHDAIGEAAIVAFIDLASIRERLAERGAHLAEPLARGRARRT